jgi:replicative DNA helicase
MQRQTPMGVLTGWKHLDARTKGFQAGELIVVGGSEGMGKTTWMMSMIIRMLANGMGVVLFSLEMTRRETLQALAAMLSGVPRGALKSGVLTTEQHGKLLMALSQVQRLPLYVVDKEEHPALTPLQHRRLTTRFQRQTEVYASFIDGLWLMEPTPRRTFEREEKNRIRDVHNITRDLIQNGDTLRLPTILMHQYRSEFYTRMMSRAKKVVRQPVLQDFAESSSVRRNAQVVIALNRPAMFSEATTLGLPTADDMYAYILKDRNNGYVTSAEYTRYHYDLSHSMYTEV